MHPPKKILITGGSGLIGRALTDRLQEQGYEVSHLGRSVKRSDVKTFVWDPDSGKMDENSLSDVDVIVHLAGAGIADKRWNDRRKREILSSRADTARMLVERLKSKSAHRVTALISASGISYYGLESPERPFEETDPPADDFMARVTIAWENAVRDAEREGIRVVMVRTGMVLSREGGALSKLAMPVRFGVGAALGSGDQYMNWIHIDDLCSLYIRAIEDVSMSGPYNGVAPQPVTNRAFTRMLAQVLRRPLWMPAVPGFAVRLMVGEVADVILNGGRISSSKLQNAGFDFRFPELKPALEDLLVSAARR